MSDKKKKAQCPECKSVKTRLAGYMITRQGRFQRALCLKCGRSFTPGHRATKTGSLKRPDK